MHVLGVCGSTFWVHKQLKIPLSLSLSDSQSIIVAPSPHIYLILSQEVLLSSILHGFSFFPFSPSPFLQSWLFLLLVISVTNSPVFPAMSLKIKYAPGILKLEKKETEKMILFFGGYWWGL